MISGFPAPRATGRDVVAEIGRIGVVVLIDNRTAFAGIMEDRKVGETLQKGAIGFEERAGLIVKVVERIRDVARMAVGVEKINSLRVVGTIFHIRPYVARAGLNKKLWSGPIGSAIR